MTTNAAPRSSRLLPPAAQERQGLRAGVVSRAAVMLLDIFVVAASMAVAYVTWGGLRFARRSASFSWPSLSFGEVVILFYVACVLYLTIGWTTAGRTAGKRVFGLRLVARDGRPPALGLAFVRALVCVSFPLLLLWSAVDRSNRSVADLVLRTSVVYDWLARPGFAGHAGDASGEDALGAGVDVAAAVPDEPDEGETETVAGADRQ